MHKGFQLPGTGVLNAQKVQRGNGVQSRIDPCSTYVDVNERVIMFRF